MHGMGHWHLYMGWPVMYVCGISWSYSLTVCQIQQLNWKLECINYFKIKEGSFDEKYAFKYN